MSTIGIRISTEPTQVLAAAQAEIADVELTIETIRTTLAGRHGTHHDDLCKLEASAAKLWLLRLEISQWLARNPS